MTAYSDGHVQALKFLSVARQAEMDFDASGVYLIALADLDPALVMRACRELAHEPRREFEAAMPPVGTIRARVEQLAREDAKAAREARYLPMPPDDDEPRYICLQCHDGYWVTSAWCPGSGSQKAATKHPRHEHLSYRLCDRRKGHAAHTWTWVCSCVATNPVIQKARESQRDRLEARGRRPSA